MDKTEKKPAGSSVWEIKDETGKSSSSREPRPRRKSYPDRPERDFQDKPRRYSTSSERDSYSDRDERKPRRPYSDRPERDSRDKPRRYSTSSERENYSDRGERKPRRSYSDRPERDFQDKPRRYSSDSTLHTRRNTGKSSLQEKQGDGLVRLNKFIANSGICSRREADEYIVAGVVSVNGCTVTELGTKVRKDDDVRFNEERLKGENKAYLLLNKPKDYITTTEDPHAKKTVMELIAGACRERIYPVGRLDRNTTGVLLFTNDGDLAKQLTHPSYNKLKVYQVQLDKNITRADLQTLLEGVDLEDGQAAADNIHISETNKAELGVEIHSGRNRVIRRMFEKLGYGIVKLDRIYFAGLTKKGLRRGHYRLLTSREVEMLKMGAYE
ncbi:MAG: pseudouridine synthase [Prevotellaceae bacterium]|nr:pseudouridine synthase [Prevotellaceae bacterium]